MMIIKRLIYIPYYIIKTNWRLFFKYARFVKNSRGKAYVSIYKDVLFTMVKHNASPLDYFSLRFYDMKEEERASFACTGFIYEYQLQMNPKAHRVVLENKIEFLKRFKDFSGRKWATLPMLKSDPFFAKEFLENAKGKIVIKASSGQAGKQVEVIAVPDNIPDDVIKLMEARGFDLLEYYVTQHDDLMKLSPSAVNTIRIVTQYFEERVIVLLAFVRISVNAPVDNLSVGAYGVNFGAPINLETGEICGEGVYLDITKPNVNKHPVTNTPIIGFKIPLWEECYSLVTKAAALTPENRSIGWDVAVTNEGPVLIEGNHNWNLLSMVPGGKGFRKDLLYFSSMLGHKD